MNVGTGPLVAWWAGFVALWCGAVFIVVLPVNFLACNAENLELEEGSPKERYCDGARDYLNWGEPSELTTPLPILLPLALLAAIGAYGAWRGNKRFLKRAAVVAAAALAAHILLVIALPG